jgi:methionyl-tRNA formyltransferase
VRVIIEEKTTEFPYPVAHPFEAERDEYEWQRWFGGRKPAIEAIAQTVRVRDVNQPEAVTSLRELSPDVIVVFGTGRIHPPVTEFNPGRIVNLHGGDPEFYRGLDTHLWAIWHRDFKALVTTLHLLDWELDSGSIISQAQVPIHHGMELHQFRAANTEICIELTIRALEEFVKSGAFDARPQRKIGRYYSAMPAVLKDTCMRRFAQYTERL